MYICPTGNQRNKGPYRQHGLPTSVSLAVYCDGMGCHTMCLNTVMGCADTFAVGWYSNVATTSNWAPNVGATSKVCFGQSNDLILTKL